MVRSSGSFHKIVRGSSALLAAVVGFLAVTHATAYYLRQVSPDLAHRLAPFDGRITALAAIAKSGTYATANDRHQADVLARNSLRQDATAVLAASTLGLNAQVRDDVSSARRLFRFAETLSRRETQTQLWAIEDAVDRGDITNALVHYDTALRVTPQLSTLLFPVLLSASTDPAIETPLVETLLRKPAWGGRFVDYAAENTKDPRALARLVSNLDRRGFAVRDAVRAGIINAFIAADMFDDAWSYYASVRPSVRRDKSRDPTFVANLKAPSLFDWVVTNAAETSTSIQSGADGGVFTFEVSAGTATVLLLQQQFLSPGKYRLTGRSSGIDKSERTRPYWILVCRNGRELGRSTIPNSSEFNGEFRAAFTVSEDCPTQTLSLVAPPVGDASPLSGHIDRVQLMPAR